MTADPVEQYSKEIRGLTAHLIGRSLVDDYNAPARRDRGQFTVVESDYWATDDIPLMRSIPYADLYARLAGTRAFDLRLLDGGLVQYRFEFAGRRSRNLVRSRLAYLPSPDLTPFQQDPEIYLGDELFGDVVDVKAVTVPIRFDFDSRSEVVRDLDHPVSHVTLGQYPHCRIAATGAVTPHLFLEFVLRCFYRTETTLETHDLPARKVLVNPTITTAERELLHFGLPTGTPVAPRSTLPSTRSAARRDRSRRAF